MLKKAMVVVDYQGPEGVSRVEEERIDSILGQGRMTAYKTLFVEVETSLVEKIFILRGEGHLAPL